MVQTNQQTNETAAIAVGAYLNTLAGSVARYYQTNGGVEANKINQLTTVGGLGLSKIEFLLLSQVIIFLLGWPLEWTEIIVIFMPIFIPLLSHFQVDPLFFGLLVALNLQTAFLSPPVAMAAFYLKGVAPPHVTLNQIFAGMMPYMFIVIACMVFMYILPGMTLWLPKFLYGG